MHTALRPTALPAALVVTIALSGGLAAQSALTQLGLTESAARTFVLDEITSPSSGRIGAIAIAGTRAFLKLPSSARGAAATGLFAWAKAYVNSPAFKTSYASFRQSRIAPSRQYPLTVEQQVRKDIDQQLAGFEQMRQSADKMPPANRASILEQVEKAQANLTDPAFIKKMEAIAAAERAQESGSRADANTNVEGATPADPNVLFARRLREFLNATADVNFSAKTINLTGGLDGIEFVDKADRAKPWMWQEAALVGPEATAAARTAAEAWLREIER
jgi:hypothetical protein